MNRVGFGRWARLGNLARAMWVRPGRASLPGLSHQHDWVRSCAS